MRNLNFSKLLVITGLILTGWLLFPISMIIHNSIVGDASYDQLKISIVPELYKQLFTQANWSSSFLTSLAVSTTATSVGAVLALLVVIKIKMRSTRIPYLTGFLTLLFAPMLIPTIVLGIALSNGMRIVGVTGTVPVLSLIHVIYTLPLILISLLVAARNIPADVIEASATSGAPPRTTLFRVLLPALSRGLLIGMVLAFFFSLDELVVTQFVASSGVIPLSLRLWSGLRYYMDPVVFAVGGFTIVMGSIFLLGIVSIGSHGHANRNSEGSEGDQGENQESRWWSVGFLAIVAVGIFGIIFYHFGPVLVKDYPVMIIVLVLIILLLALASQFLSIIKRRRAGIPDLLVLLITGMSILAFGLGEDGGLQLEIKNIAAILVLYMLAQLGVHLFTQSRKISTQLRDTGAKVRVELEASSDNVLNDFTARTTSIMTRLDQLEKSLKVEDLTRAAGIIEFLAPYIRDLFGKSKEAVKIIVDGFTNLGKKWVDIYDSADKIDRRILFPIWNEIAKKYLEAEVEDLSRPDKLYGTPEPIIITSDSFYLGLLKSLVSALDKVSDPKERIVYRGVTVIIPEYWYNWPRAPLEEKGSYELGGMANYRQEVQETVHNLRRANGRYDRLVLLAGDETVRTEFEFPSAETLEEQQNLYLIGTSSQTDEYSIDPMSNSELQDVAGSIGLKPRGLPGKEDLAYFIVPLDEVLQDHLNGARKKKDGNILQFDHDGKRYNVQSLLERYKNDLHTRPAHAKYNVLNSNDIRRYLRQVTSHDKDFDLWLMGILPKSARMNESPKWIVAISTNMIPGHSTLQLKIVTHPERVKAIGTFWHTLYVKGKPWP